MAWKLEERQAQMRERYNRRVAGEAKAQKNTVELYALRNELAATQRRLDKAKDIINKCFTAMGADAFVQAVVGATPLHGESDISGDRAEVAQEKEQ